MKSSKYDYRSASLLQFGFESTRAARQGVDLNVVVCVEARRSRHHIDLSIYVVKNAPFRHGNHLVPSRRRLDLALGIERDVTKRDVIVRPLPRRIGKPLDRQGAEKIIRLVERLGSGKEFELRYKDRLGQMLPFGQKPVFLVAGLFAHGTFGEERVGG